MPELRSETRKREMMAARLLEERRDTAQGLFDREMTAGTSVVVNYEKGILEVDFSGCDITSR